MSNLYTALVCKKVIADIKSAKIKSYEETLQALSKLSGNFRRMGLADMCWNLQELDFYYSVSRMMVHKYDYRFKNTPLVWNKFSDHDKEQLAFIMQRFEHKTNLLCGLQYDFYVGKDLCESKLSFISPNVYFLPALENEKYYLQMQNLAGEKVYFSLDKSESQYTTKIALWQFKGCYSLNKLIAAIQDRRLIFSADNEILLQSNFQDS